MLENKPTAAGFEIAEQLSQLQTPIALMVGISLTITLIGLLLLYNEFNSKSYSLSENEIQLNGGKSNGYVKR